MNQQIKENTGGLDEAEPVGPFTTAIEAGKAARAVIVKRAESWASR